MKLTEKMTGRLRLLRRETINVAHKDLRMRMKITKRDFTRGRANLLQNFVNQSRMQNDTRNVNITKKDFCPSTQFELRNFFAIVS